MAELTGEDDEPTPGIRVEGDDRAPVAEPTVSAITAPTTLPRSPGWSTVRRERRPRRLEVTEMDMPPTPQALSQVHLAEVGVCDACLRSGRQRLNVGLALGATLPGAYLGLALLAGLPLPQLTAPLEAVVFGLAVVGEAFVLSWAAELAALEISAGLAISVLALVAVLPEYAVDFVFAWRGGNAVQANGTCQQDGQDPCSLALANMTGANRLLIGIGWALVVLLVWFRFRGQGRPRSGVRLPRSSAVEVTYLALATVYSLTLPLKRTATQSSSDLSRVNSTTSVPSSSSSKELVMRSPMTDGRRNHMLAR